jgi:malonate decarboxylase alpha subunit
MEAYVAARPDVFFTGRDGSLRSNRAFCQMAGQYAVDMFIGSTLQMDGDGHSSTVTHGRLSGFGGARIWATTRMAAVMPARPGWT